MGRLNKNYLPTLEYPTPSPPSPSPPSAPGHLPIRDPALKSRLTGLIFALCLLVPLVHITRLDPAVLLDPANLAPLAHFLTNFWPPAHDSDFLELLLQAAVETLAIATAGLALAIFVAIPLALAITRRLSLSQIGPRRPGRVGYIGTYLRLPARGGVLILRGVPELVWALIFVRIFGLGPTAGVLAMGITYGGMLAKVYSEILDSTDGRPCRALLESGSPRLGALLLGLMPQASSELISYTVYRWECAIRASVVMGFVGAGGLGQLMDQSMKMLNGSEAATILITFIVLVALADLISRLLRRLLG